MTVGSDGTVPFAEAAATQRIAHASAVRVTGLITVTGVQRRWSVRRRTQVSADPTNGSRATEDNHLSKR
jgi:hypothetical protein